MKAALPKPTVSLFIPCFVDQLLPQVAVDTVKVLCRIGYEVEYPEDQTCCGQPAFNSGYWNDARPCAEHFVQVFKNADVVVCPSGSCTTMVRNSYPDLLRASPYRADAIALASRTFELSEFLVKVAAVTDVGATFSHTVTYHAACHGLRELKLRDEPLQLLRAVDGLKLIEMPRFEECCGFGGTFATKFADISAAMGVSKADSVAATGAEFVTAIDPSCLLHLEGILGKRRSSTRTIHIASILACTSESMSKSTSEEVDGSEQKNSLPRRTAQEQP
jgi:L-lactate dehydrogenase complex protein LldE